jgi:hypothetical protein
VVITLAVVGVNVGIVAVGGVGALTLIRGGGCSDIVGIVPSPSRADIKRVSKSCIQHGTPFKVKAADWTFDERGLGYGHQGVAIDDADFWQPLSGSDFDLGPNAAHRSRHGGARHRGEHFDCGISCQHADGSPPWGSTEIGPVGIAALHHSGTVWADSSAANRTNSGSCGIRR